MKSVLILAAGIGSRYGGTKQIDGFGPNGETLLEYALNDAIEAGFTQLVFVVRAEIQTAVEAIFVPKFKEKATLVFVCQPTQIGEIEREKPWGTAHAVLCAKSVIQSPFIVINADDFYGKSAYQKAAHFLDNPENENQAALIGYPVLTTLSVYGAVTRGVCSVDEAGFLIRIDESKVSKSAIGVSALSEAGVLSVISEKALVSMNFWCFYPAVFPFIETAFREFVLENKENPKAELPIPPVIDALIAQKQLTVSVIPTADAWFGVTYPEDKTAVMEKIAMLK